MDKVDSAVVCFKSGFNCAQSVFTAFCGDCGLDEKIALKIAGSFGAGMGYIGEACGAVTGALMAIGLMYGYDDVKDKNSKDKTYSMVKEFVTKFKKLNGSVRCNELIPFDLSEEKQLIAARQTDVFITKCPKYVGDAVCILEELFGDTGV